MIIFNICILLQLAYSKNQAKIEGLIAVIDKNIEKYIRLIPFVSKKLAAVDMAKK